MNPEAGPQFDPSQQVNMPNTREIMEEWNNLPAVEAEMIAKEQAAAAKQAEWEQKRETAQQLLADNEGAMSSLVFKDGVLDAKKSGKVTRVDEDGNTLHLDGKKLFKAATDANEAIGYTEGRSDRIEELKAELYDIAEKAMSQGKTSGGERANDSIARGRALRAELSELTAAERTYNDHVSKVIDAPEVTPTPEPEPTPEEPEAPEEPEIEEPEAPEEEPETPEEPEASVEAEESFYNPDGTVKPYKTPGGKEFKNGDQDMHDERFRLVAEGDVAKWDHFVAKWKEIAKKVSKSDEVYASNMEKIEQSVALSTKLLLKNKAVFDANPDLTPELKRRLVKLNSVEIFDATANAGEHEKRLKFISDRMNARYGRRVLRKAGVQLNLVPADTSDDEGTPTLIVEDAPAASETVAEAPAETTRAEGTVILDADAPRDEESTPADATEALPVPTPPISNEERIEYESSINATQFAEYMALTQEARNVRIREYLESKEPTPAS